MQQKEEKPEDPASYESYWMPQFDHTVMPIAAFIGPPSNSDGKNFLTLERYAELKESGINTVYAVSEDLPLHGEEVKQSLKYCEQLGLSLVAMVNNAWNMNQSQLEYAFYHLTAANSPALGGIYVMDEPGDIHYERLRGVRDVLEAMFPGILYHVNLLPVYNEDVLYNRGEPGHPTPEGYTYADYVNNFLSRYRPQVLSYDYYPFHYEFPWIWNTYYENLSIIRAAAKRQKIPYWVYIQTCSFGATVRVPTRSEIQWQVNTSLAYGAKGIQYFTYWLPEDGIQIFNGAMIDRKGNRTPVYDYVREANRQIAAVDEVLMRANSEGVMVVGATPCTVPSEDRIYEFRQLRGARGIALLIGCFDYRGRTALYVVNNSIDLDEDSALLEFDSCVSGFVVQSGSSKSFSGENLPLALKAGEGALVVLE